MPGLIANPGKIWLAVEPVDMRRGIDGLSMIVQQTLGQSPCAGSAYVFCNRAGSELVLDPLRKPVTASFGLAQWRSGESATKFMGRADSAMYRAKAAGRNCIKIDSV